MIFYAKEDHRRASNAEQYRKPHSETKDVELSVEHVEKWRHNSSMILVFPAVTAETRSGLGAWRPKGGTALPS